MRSNAFVTHLETRCKGTSTQEMDQTSGIDVGGSKTIFRANQHVIKRVTRDSEDVRTRKPLFHLAPQF